MRSTVHTIIAETLAHHGVRCVFGLIGDANMLYITDFARDHGGRFVPSAFEGSAVSMAAGYAHATGQVGVCSVTHGPALTNSLTALTEATRGRRKVLLITGDTSGIPGHLQELDMRAVCNAAGVRYLRIADPSTAWADVDRAVRYVTNGQAPCVLDAPYEFLERETDANGDLLPSAGPLRAPLCRPDPDAVDEALGLVASARRPVILAGLGAVHADAGAALAALATCLGAPVGTTLQAKDLFASHARNLGICGTLASAKATEAFAQSDCVLAFGASLNKYTADNGHLLGPKQRIVQIDIDPLQIGTGAPIEMGVVGDARITAEAMTARLAELKSDATGNSGAAAWTGVASEADETGAFGPYRDRSTDVTVDVRTALLKLDQLLPAERALVTDVGRFMTVAWRALHVRNPLDFMHTAHFASIGLGLSTAAGVAVARPDRTTVAVVGDGGFMMDIQALHVAQRERLPLVVIVVNDNAYGMEWRKLNDRGFSPEFSLSRWPSLGAVAGSMGVATRRIECLADLEAFDDRDVRTGEPLLIDVHVDPTHDVR